MIEKDGRRRGDHGGGAPGLFIPHLRHGLAREAQFFAPVRTVLQYDDGGRLSTANRKGEGAPAPDHFIVLVGCDDNHRPAKGRPDRDGANEVGEIVRRRSQGEHAQVDIAQPGLQEHFKLAAPIQQGERVTVDLTQVLANHPVSSSMLADLARAPGS